ncbi:iron-sulfur cluster assembly accessory protein [Ferrovibrio sp.]|uniref:HesB/IscA family protein n=1 Tax=Ferrovibrio sp. TaxID=1917215 RepID=UPI00311EFE35
MAATETAAAPRPAFKPVTLTDAAAARIRELIARADRPIVGLRIGIKTKGCSGMSYDIDYAEEKGKFDELVEDKGVTVLIEPKAQMYIFGTEIDWVEDKLQSGFVFRNPNEKGRCGCGESFHV